MRSISVRFYHIDTRLQLSCGDCGCAVAYNVDSDIHIGGIQKADTSLSVDNLHSADRRKPCDIFDMGRGGLWKESCVQPASHNRSAWNVHNRVFFRSYLPQKRTCPQNSFNHTCAVDGGLVAVLRACAFYAYAPDGKIHAGGTRRVS